MSRSLCLEDLYRITVPEAAVISPDGTAVVYVLRRADAELDRDRTELWTVGVGGDAGGAAGAPPMRLTQGPADTAPAFSPDGSRVAFLRSVDDGPAQMHLLPLTGGEAVRLTDLAYGAGQPVWSPDGTRIAFAAPVGEVPPAGTEPPIVCEDLFYQADGVGVVGDLRTQIHIVDLSDPDSVAVTQLTDRRYSCGEPAWSPDGRRLTFCGPAGEDADLTGASAAFVMGAEPPDTDPVPVGSVSGLAELSLFTADGESLLVVCAPTASPANLGLRRVPLDGGASVDLTGGIDRNVVTSSPVGGGGYPRLTPDGSRVVVCVRDGGTVRAVSLPVDGPAPADLAAAPLVFGADDCGLCGLSVTTDPARPLAVTVLDSRTSFGEVAVFGLDGAAPPRLLTRHGVDLATESPLLATEPRAFTAPDGAAVHGWLLRDPSAAAPAPMLLDIHGGPHHAWTGTASTRFLHHQVLARAGWAVLTVNPRGSDGYGDAWMAAVTGDWGRSDHADFLCAVDELVAEGIADPDRLAVTGYSYGGYMTCYLTGHDGRFAAAVAGAPASDLASIAGTSDMGLELGARYVAAAPWRDADRLAGQSPLSKVAEVRTPTLLLQGQADLRCPVGQAQEWFTALRANGVPTRLVLYPGASHGFFITGRPSHRIDFGRRLIEWVEHYAGRPRAIAGAPSGARRRGSAGLDAGRWQRRLDQLAARFGVPGAALGVVRIGPQGDEDEMLAAGTGVTSLDTGIAVTPDALFQIGSISKIWTTTMVMQMVDEGRLDLDAPVHDLLSDLVLRDEDVARRVTMRHLLTHTSGVDGDVFIDTGRGDDAVRRYVARLAEVAQNHPLGATFSYCNAGFVLAGHVLSTLTGESWEELVRTRLAEPLGLRRTTTLPEEALLHRAAVGHLDGPHGTAVPAPTWMLPRAVSPAGLITASVADLLAFAAMHLRGGLAADGTRILSAESVSAMQRHQVTLPTDEAIGHSWGLGWMRFTWGGVPAIGHDGGTIGQTAYLRLIPESGVALALLTNGGYADDLCRALLGELVPAAAGVTMPPPLEPASGASPVDGSRFAGVYERAGERIEVRADGTRLWMRVIPTGELAELEPKPDEEWELLPLGEGTGAPPEGLSFDGTVEARFVARPAGARMYKAVTFYRIASGARYLHYFGRATPQAG